MFNFVDARICKFFATEDGVLVSDGCDTALAASRRVKASLKKGRYDAIAVTVKPKPVVVFEDSDTLDADGIQELLDAAESEA